MIGLADLLSAGPAVPVGECALLSLVFLVCLNHSILLKLNQTTLRVPRLYAAKQENNMDAMSFKSVCPYYLHLFPLLTLQYNHSYTDQQSKLKVFYLYGVTVFVLHVLISPLRGDRVLVEKVWDPGFVSSLPGFLPLSFLQHKLLLSGTQLVPIHDGSGHMLPKSATFKSDAN